MQERKAFLERTLHSVRKEKEHAERELNDLKGDLSCKSRELNRLQSHNESFKTKLEELEAARDVIDKTDIEAKLDEMRREKDGLEIALSEASQLREKAEFEIGKLRESSSNLKDELERQIVSREEKLAEAEGKVANLRAEKSRLVVELQELQNSVTELEVKCQHHLTDKRLKLLSFFHIHILIHRELRANLSEVQKKNDELQVCIVF